MKTWAGFLRTAYTPLFPAMFILPFFSAKGYSLLRHTTSHLGAQNTPYAWVMNLMFVLLAVSCVIEAWRYLGHYWFHKVVLTVYGVGLVLVALFQTW